MADTEMSFDGIGNGLQLVASAGTAEALSATSIKCRRIRVQALPENTGVAVIGSSTVVAAAATRQGISLAPGQSEEFPIKDVSTLYVDATVTGEGVSYVYFY